ncbi:MAG: hypothetical protein WD468_13125 [Pirellulales bacterium]
MRALLVVGLTLAAASQARATIVPLSQFREVSALAESVSLGRLCDIEPHVITVTTDTHRLTAPDFGSFDEDIVAHVQSIPGTVPVYAHAGARMNSELRPDRIVVSGQTSVFVNSVHECAEAFGQATAKFEIAFRLTAPGTYKITHVWPLWSTFDGVSTSATLSGPTGTTTYQGGGYPTYYGLPEEYDDPSEIPNPLEYLGFDLGDYYHHSEWVEFLPAGDYILAGSSMTTQRALHTGSYDEASGYVVTVQHLVPEPSGAALLLGAAAVLGLSVRSLRSRLRRHCGVKSGGK